MRSTSLSKKTAIILVGLSLTAPSPPTIRWASITPGEERTRTSISASRPCRATRSAIKTVSTARACGSRSRSNATSGFDSKHEIEEFGLDNFSRECRKRVEHFSAVQTNQSIRLGQWMDWDNSYYTMDDANIEHIWYFLKRCHEKGWLYEGWRLHALVHSLRHQPLAA